MSSRLDRLPLIDFILVMSPPSSEARSAISSRRTLGFPARTTFGISGSPLNVLIRGTIYLICPHFAHILIEHLSNRGTRRWFQIPPLSPRNHSLTDYFTAKGVRGCR